MSTTPLIMSESFRSLCAELVRAMDSYPLRPKAHRDLCNQTREALAASDLTLVGAREPDFRLLCVKLVDRWINAKDYWSVIAEIQGALAFDPRNDEDYCSYNYGTEPIPGDTTWITPNESL